jgi:hypothetical protein
VGNDRFLCWIYNPQPFEVPAQAWMRNELTLSSASVVAGFFCCGSLVFLLFPAGKITLSPDSGQVSQGEPGVSPAKNVAMILFHISVFPKKEKQWSQDCEPLFSNEPDTGGSRMTRHHVVTRCHDVSTRQCASIHVSVRQCKSMHTLNMRPKRKSATSVLHM